MINTNYQQMVKEAVKPKFKGKQRIRGKVVPRYPDTARREFERMNRRYVQAFKKALDKFLPGILKAYSRTRTDSRYDDLSDVWQEFGGFQTELEKLLSEFNLYDMIHWAGELTQKASAREWKREVWRTFGIDIFEDVYRGETYEQLVNKWTADNVLLIARAAHLDA